MTMNKIVKILLRDRENQPIGLLVMDSTVKWKEFSETENIDEFICTITKLVKAIKTIDYFNTAGKPIS